jgi:ribosomal protein S21
MIIVNVERGNLEKALKQYKSKVIRCKQMTELNNRKTFEKKSIQRRNEINKAKNVQKYLNGLS